MQNNNNPTLSRGNLNKRSNLFFLKKDALRKGKTANSLLSDKKSHMVTYFGYLNLRSNRYGISTNDYYLHGESQKRSYPWEHSGSMVKIRV